MYKEILRLKKMLEEAKIPFWWKEKHFDGHQIEYPYKGNEKCICSVIEFEYSYGSKEDLLEIMGLTTEKEEQKEDDDVLGYLTAENVFNRIKAHWNSLAFKQCK